MALVAYSDESDYEEEEEQNDVDSKISLVTNVVDKLSVNQAETKITETKSISDDEYGEEAIQVKKSAIFASVPLPSRLRDNFVEEESVIPVASQKEREVANVLEEEKRKIKEAKQKGKVKIVLPSLAQLSDEDLPVKKEKTTLKIKSGSGLLSMLPDPKQGGGKQLNRSLIPNSLLKPRAVISINKLGVKHDAKLDLEKKITTADSDEESGTSDFFSLHKEKETINAEPLPLEDIVGPSYAKKRPASPVLEQFQNPYTSGIDSYEEVTHTEEHPVSELSLSQPSQVCLDEKALMQLQGKRARFNESIQIRDISEASIRSDPNEWLKQVSVEKASIPGGYSASKKDGPDAASRRKHQMTYLVHQAKAREVELKNQWASNRQTKRQTQSKYGF
ncbi:proline-rich protein PRCC-like [Artemia franciscana]|uniref:proline-rich protein PRCC-like n=1 Tax=Artemia franciscana TaxID=6661 RepID=UPI0032DB4614